MVEMKNKGNNNEDDGDNEGHKSAADKTWELLGV